MSSEYLYDAVYSLDGQVDYWSLEPGQALNNTPTTLQDLYEVPKEDFFKLRPPPPSYPEDVDTKPNLEILGERPNVTMAVEKPQLGEWIIEIFIYHRGANELVMIAKLIESKCAG